MENYKNVSAENILKNLRDRINQENITFLQIGANDGYTNDIASLILKPSDKG